MQPPRVWDVHLGTPRNSVYSYTSIIPIGKESDYNFLYRLIGLVNKTVHPHHLTLGPLIRFSTTTSPLYNSSAKSLFYGNPHSFWISLD
jgi:hypothetical protein